MTCVRAVPGLPGRSSATNLPPNGLSRQVASKGVVRIGVAREIAPLLREFGADPDAVLRQASVSARLFRDKNNFILYAAQRRTGT